MKAKLLFSISIFLSFVVYAQEKPVWDYPVKPGTEEWNQFESVDEMYQACQIPDNVLKQLDTESLVDICLGFPAPPLFPLFNTPQQAFLMYYYNFNGIQELFNRKDAGRYLLKKYVMMSLSDFNPLWELHEQGRFISRYKFIEAIMSQSQVISSLDAKGRKELLKEAIHKLDEKISKDDLFGGYSIEINLWVMGKILYNENRSLLQEFDQKNLQTAMESGMFVDIDVDILYQLSKKYAYENE